VDASIFLFTLLGIACGTCTGLVPGIHVNTAAPLATHLACIFGATSICAASFLCTMSLTHTFIDFIPATFLGVPDSETALSLLPAHRMVKEGRGLEAIWISGVSSLGAACLVAAALPLSIRLLPGMMPLLTRSTPYVLVFFLLLMVAADTDARHVLCSCAVVAVAGAFGMATLGAPQFSGDVLFPVFSGFFGISTLLLSIGESTALPPQSRPGYAVTGTMAKSCVAGTLAGIVVATMPGIGASQATILSSKLRSSGGGSTSFIASCCATNTSNAMYALVMLYLFKKARNGALVHVRDIMGDLTQDEYLLLMASMCVAGAVSFLVLLSLSSCAIRLLSGISYFRISIAGIAIQAGAIVALEGVAGLFLAALATVIGLLPPSLGISRTTLMAYLLVPVLGYYT